MSILTLLSRHNAQDKTFDDVAKWPNMVGFSLGIGRYSV
jgi:hypothetical protein